MRKFVLIGVCLTFALAGCGSSGQTSGSTAGESASGTKHVAAKKPPCPRGPKVIMSKAEIAKLPPLTIPRQSGPPPHHLTIVDLRKGSGPGIPKNDWVTNRENLHVKYFVVPYRRALAGPASGQYGPRKYLPQELQKGLVLGMTGMRVGGRRVVTSPPKLVYPSWQPSWGYTPYVDVYVVDLLGMEPPPDRRTEYRHGRPC